MGGVGDASVVVAEADIRVVALLIGHVCQGVDKKHGFAKVFKLQGAGDLLTFV